jgi:carbonic anhydrase
LAILWGTPLGLGLQSCTGAEDQTDEAVTGQDEPEAQAPHWGYGPEDGPAVWASLTAEWAVCGDGQRQSPIDLPTGLEPEEGSKRRRYVPAALRIARNEHVADILDNGHTIQVNSDAGGVLELDGMEFYLIQGHFHSPSEHTVEGEHAPLEMHLVHEGPGGRLAVVGLLIEEGDRTAAFDAIIQNLPSAPGEMRHVEGVTVNALDLLPDSELYYRYEGSLTTPPCLEIVTWLVMAESVTLSGEQMRSFTSLIPGTNRPVQPLNGREVLLRAAAGQR